MGFEGRRRLKEPLGAPCQGIGDGGLNKDVSNKVEMMTSLDDMTPFFCFFVFIDK